MITKEEERKNEKGKISMKMWPVKTWMHKTQKMTKFVDLMSCRFCFITIVKITVFLAQFILTFIKIE